MGYVKSFLHLFLNIFRGGNERTNHRMGRDSRVLRGIGAYCTEAAAGDGGHGGDIHGLGGKTTTKKGMLIPEPVADVCDQKGTFLMGSRSLGIRALI